MSIGYSYESFAGVVDVDRDTLYHWETLHPIFSDAKKTARGKQQKELERIGLAAMKGMLNGFNTAVWAMYMKNCCKWHDGDRPEENKNNNQPSKLVIEYD